LGYRVERFSLRFKVMGLGFRVERFSLRFKVMGSGIRVERFRVQGLELTVQHLRIRI
jgi:hypothetical protein